MNTGDCLYQCHLLGYNIEIEKTERGKKAVFCSRWWKNKRVDGQEYTDEWSDHDIQKDQLTTLMQKAGLTVREKVEMR